MQCFLLVDGIKIPYELTYKDIKNINLRIKPDGRVSLSVPRRSKPAQIEGFLKQRGNWILTNLEKMQRHQENLKQFDEKPILHDEEMLIRLFAQVYERFREVVPQKPTLCIRTMKSRWGSCIPAKGKITLNRELLKAHECSIEYVLTHEFIHFSHPNHSKNFYACFVKMMPDYKEQKKFLQEQRIL